MRNRWSFGAVATLVLMMAACSDSGSPATTPVASTPATTTTTMPATTTTASPAPSPTTTAAPVATLAPTTTIDRLAEVQAIIQDLEERRLDALFREDEEAFRTLFANDAYLEFSLEVLGTVDFVAEPKDLVVEVREIVADTGDCLAIVVFNDLSQTLGPEAVGESREVLELGADGEWGYSYSGAGWACDGPHPLDG